MSSYLGRTFNLSKKFLISNKSYFPQYFSAFSSIHVRNGCNNNLKCCTYLKINKPNAVQKRNFSLSYLYYVQSLYDSIGYSAASKLVKEILIETHDFSGFSWAVIIIAASAVVKLLIALPCGIYQKMLMSKIELTDLELIGMIKTLREKLLTRAIKELWTEKKMLFELKSEFKKQRKILFVKNNCHPFKVTILLLIQLPFWLLISITLKKFAVDAHTGQSDFPVAALQFQVGGPFWCPNLSLPDPIFVLPTINCLASLTNLELSYLYKTPEKITSNKKKFLLTKIIRNFSRLSVVVFVFISALLPSGVTLFWTSCSLFALAQNLLLMSPKIRRFFKIPVTPSEFDKPYSQAWNRFTEKLKMVVSGKNE